MTPAPVDEVAEGELVVLRRLMAVEAAGIRERAAEGPRRDMLSEPLVVRRNVPEREEPEGVFAL